MVDISSQNNKINITVSSSGNTANTNVTPDYAQYYSEKSKEWAISNKIVDNTDYSSKYYANESKKQADISTAKATEVIESGNNAVSNIESARDNAIIDITNQESLSVDNVNTAGATQVSSVNTAGITQVANVNSAGTTQINLAKEQVTLATNQANIATEQATIATNKTSEVVASGNNALSNIDTAKNNAITSITNQETTSKTSLIDEGATQIGLIQNEGATQVANVQSTGQTEYNKIIATGIDYKANTDLSNLSEAGEKHFLNKSNKSEISGWGMPSSKYIDLTLGDSGSTYTAPANGWFSIRGNALSASLAMVALWRGNVKLGSRSYSYTNTAEPWVYLPVKKGETIHASYSNVKNIALSFFYAEGEV